MISPDVARKIVCRYSAAFVADVAAEGGRTSEALALLEDLVARIFVVSVKPAGLDVAFTQFATDAAEILGAVTAAAAARAENRDAVTSRPKSPPATTAAKFFSPLPTLNTRSRPPPLRVQSPKRRGIDIEELTS